MMNLLQGFEQTTKGIDPYVNSDKTEFICFKQDGGIYNQLELVDLFTYFTRNNLSMENNINISI